MSAKFHMLLLVFLLGLVFIANSQVVEDKLAVADSLFLVKKYTESFELYEQIFQQDAKYSSQMLLKMAFIKEGLGEYDKALFYLYKYYQIGYDASVFEKISKLASEYNLLGYSISDSFYFVSILRRYMNIIYIGLSILIFIMLVVVIFKKFYLKEKPAYSSATLILLACVMLVLNNFLGAPSEAIVSNSKTILLSGPSSGADFIEVIGKGHKVNVMSSNDVWAKIDVNGRQAFTRSSNLMLIP